MCKFDCICLTFLALDTIIVQMLNGSPSRVLVVAARDRDARRGCGGAMDVHAKAGARVRVLVDPAPARLTRELGAFRPELVYTHGPADDAPGRAVHARVDAALGALPPGAVRELRWFEPAPRAAAADFRPNLFVDVSAGLAAKTKALGRAAGQLARLRGAQAGVAAAEAFTVAYRIVP
jgi:LmbE family N-acetylglucosaminyl deacetylase